MNSASHAAPPLRQRLGLAAPWVTLMFLAMSFALSFFDRMLMVVLGEIIKADFQLSDKELSILTGAAFVIIYGVVGIGAGWLIDRVSRKKILVWALSLWSVATMSCGVAANFWQLALARAAVGVGEAANVPAALSIIADLYPPKKRPMASAIFFAGGMVGVLFTFLFGAWMAETFGWRWAFIAAGPPGFILALCILFLGREPIREGDDTAGEVKDRGRSFHLFWTNKPLLWTVAAGAFSTFGTSGMMMWLPNFFIRSHQLSLTEIGLYFGPLLAAGMAGGMIGGGVIGNRVAGRSVASLTFVCFLTPLITIPVFLAMLWTPSVALALGLMFAATAICSVFSPIFASAWQTICAPRARGTAAGISGFANAIIATAVLPFAVGAMSDHWAPTFGVESLRYALTAAMVFLLIGALLFGVATHAIKRTENH